MRAVSSRMTSLEGVLERITFASEENGFSVVQLAVPGRRELVAAVGPMLGVQPGESLRLTGEWTTDRKYGEQFKVTSFLTVKPATLMGIEKYLGSGLVKGVGKVMASRLVAHFGLSTLDVIDAEPSRLVEVEGIGRVRSQRITRAWEEQREIRQVMVFLQSHGVSTSFAVRIYKHYRHRAIAVVKENPYRLALDIFGIGFKTADAIAAKLGISPTSPRRAEAGVLHLLGEASGEGHVWLPREELVKQAVEVLSIEPSIIEAAIASLQEAGHLVLEAGAPGSSDRVYSRALHAAETGLAAALSILASGKLKPLTIDVDAALAWFESRQGLQLAPEQKLAIRTAISSKVLVVTGGPGTGKTTLVNGIIQILEKKGRRLVLAAPTGRAARRMMETTGREAKTVHRLLEFSPKTNSFQKNREAPLDADVVIVDEASMLDVVLAYDIVKAIPREAQLVLVGDVDQLPSVGPGRVLGDLIDSGAVPVVRLQHIFRQAQESLIVTNAHRVNRGEFPVWPPKGSDAEPKPDFYFLERAEPEEVLSTLKEVVATRIPRGWGFDALEHIQVLTPMHRGSLGAGHLNLELQALLNPQGKTLIRGSRAFREGDKVMQIHNNYELEVFNGDIGRILSVDPVEQELVARFDERKVTYEAGDLDELVLAYACSIHKSQGSEYPCVVMPLHTQHYVMLQRNLLYTGLTRGRKLVVLIGTKKALAMAVKATGAARRFTGLEERLRRHRTAPEDSPNSLRG